MAQIPAVGRALLETIAGPESRGDYNVIYGGSQFDSYSDHPRQYVPIRSGPNAGKKSSAAGKYQFLASTWDEYQRKLSLPDFSPASQDQAAWQLAQDEYFRDTGRDLQTDLENGDLDRVAPSLRNQWTSLPGGIEQGISGGAFRTAFTSNLKGTPMPPGEIPEVATSLDVTQAKNAPLFTLGPDGWVNADTGQVVTEDNPVFNALMAYQQASAAQRPAKQAPVPASVERRVTARNAQIAAPPPTPRSRPERPQTSKTEVYTGPSVPIGLMTLADTPNPATPRLQDDGSVRSPMSVAPVPASVEDRVTARNNALEPVARLPSIAGPSDAIGEMPTFNALRSSMGGSALQIPQSYAGQDRAGTKTVMRETQVLNPEYEAALAARKEIPLGMVHNPLSRDSVAQTAAGRAMATRLPPKWITVQKPLEITVSGANPISEPQRQATGPGAALGTVKTRQAGGYLYTMAPGDTSWVRSGAAGAGTPAQRYAAANRGTGRSGPSGDPLRRWDLSTDSGGGSRDWTNTQ